MSNEVPPPNPYSPPQVGSEALQQVRLSFRIGATYWGLMFSTLLVCGAMVLVPWRFNFDTQRVDFIPAVVRTPPMGLGLLGCMAICCAAIYGLGYMFRVVQRSYVRRHERMQSRQIAFFFSSLTIGFLTTITTLTAFVTCCVPIGMFTINYSPAGLHGNLQGPVVVAILVAVIAGASMIYLLLPKADLKEV